MNIKQTKSGSFTLLVSVQKYTKIPNDKRRLTGKTKSEVKEKFVALMNEMEKGLFLYLLTLLLKHI